MSSPTCVTMTMTESLASVSMACTSSKLLPPVGEICDTSDSRPRESPTHNSSKIEEGRIPVEPEPGVIELEIAYKSPLKDFSPESFARIFRRLGQASSMARQLGSNGTGGGSNEKVRFSSGRHWRIASLVWKWTGSVPSYNGGAASRSASSR